MKLSPNLVQRMLWLVWHYCYALFQTVRFIPVVLIWLVGVFMCFDIKYPPDFAAQGYISTATWIFFIAAWFGYMFLSGSDRSAEYILIMQINSRRLYAISKVVFLLVVCIAFSVLSCLYPVVINALYQFKGIVIFHGLQPSVFIGAFLLHFIFGTLGISIPLLFQPNPTKRRDLLSIGLILIFVLLSAIKGQFIDRQSPFYYLFYVFPPFFDITNQFFDKNVLAAADLARAAVYGIVYAITAIAAGQWLYSRRIYGPHIAH